MAKPFKMFFISAHDLKCEVCKIDKWTTNKQMRLTITNIHVLIVENYQFLFVCGKSM